MYIKSKALVLHSIKYNDSSLIVHCYTETNGRQSFLLKGILSAKKGKFRKALFQPLTALEIEFQIKNKGGLNYLKDAKVRNPYQSLYTHISKNALVLFIAEILHKSLKEEDEDKLLYSYLEHALLWLDTHEEIANFHLIFMLQLSKYLGFFPHVEHPDSPYFNLESGCFTHLLSSQQCIKGQTALLLKECLGMKFDNPSLPKLNQKARRELLEVLIQYYSFHLEGFSTPKSLAVLHSVFA